jgi:hypothetical protein
VSLSRKLRLRLSAITAILSLLVLVDEIIKEGYMFDPYDLINTQITHEKIFVALFIISMLLGLRSKKDERAN